MATSSDASDDGATFDDFDFDRGDHAIVDWSEGQGPQDQITGRIEGIGRGAGDVIVDVVSYDEDGWEEGRTYDCAPDWIDTL